MNEGQSMIQVDTVSRKAIRRAVKKRSKTAALDDKNQLPLVEGFIAFVMTASICDIMLYIFAATLGANKMYVEGNPLYGIFDNAFPYISALLLFLFCVPALWGYTDMGRKALHGEEITGSDVYSGFGGINLILKIWAVGALTVLPFVAIYAASEGMDYLMELTGVTENALHGQLYEVLKGVATAALSAVALFFVGILYPAFSLISADKKMKLSEVLKISYRSTKGRLGEILILRLSFIPWILLSLVTIGILAVVFAAPYAVTLYSCFSGELTSGKYTKHN